MKYTKWILFVAVYAVMVSCAPVHRLLVSVGLVEPDGGVTPTGEAISQGFSLLTGVSLTRLYDAFFTKRGIQNVKNIPRGESGWKGALQSIVAIVLGWHTPESAKG